jgi:hypothetical protein
MADKNINFNIKVNNKELDLTKTSFKDFDKIIKQAKVDLQSLPISDPRYKVLQTDIKNADAAWKEMNKTIAQSGDDMEETGGNVETFKKQIKEATDELFRLEQQFGKNSKEYTDQKQKIAGLRDAQQEFIRTTQDLDDTLAAIPGPIGQIGQGMQQLEGISQNVGSAFTKLGISFKTTDGIIKATGIGALVLIIATLVAALIDAAKKSEPLQQAFAAIGDAVGALFDALKPVTDFILKVFVGAINLVSGAIEGLASLFGGVNRGFKQQSLALEKELKFQKTVLDNFNTALTANLTERLKIEQDYNTKLKEIIDATYTDEAERQRDLLLLILNTNGQKQNLRLKEYQDRKKNLLEISKLEGQSLIDGTDNQRKSAELQSYITKKSNLIELELLQQQNRIKLGDIKINQKMIENSNIADKDKLLEILKQSYSEELQLSIYYKDLEKNQRAANKAERLKREREYSREDIALINERSNEILQLTTGLIKEENARSYKAAQDELIILKEQHRKELEENYLAGTTTKKLKEKQAAEDAAAKEKIRLAKIQFDSYEIEQEISKQNSLLNYSTVGTKQYFDAKREIVQKEFEQENLLADGNQVKIEAARSKHWKAMLDIDKEGLQAQVDILNIEYDSLYEGTAAFYNKQRELENKNYQAATLEAQFNYDKLEALRKQHEKNMEMIDLSELNSKIDIEQRKADTVKQIFGGYFKAQREVEEMRYAASLKAAGDNTAAIEAIELEHQKKLRESKLAELQLMLDFGSKLADVASSVYNAITAVNEARMAKELKDAKGNEEEQEKIKKKYFEKNKKIQIAQAYIATFQAAVQAYSAMAGIPVVGPALGAIAAAAAIVAGLANVSKIKSTEYDSGGSSSSSAAAAEKPAMPNYGRNYADGGMIGGNRHSDGGTLIEAEKGEAIMTRGAVSMFGPMLSMMNQAGGGTSFNPNLMTTSYDKPNVLNPSKEQNPIIVKSYVVSSDMTSSQEKNARLKDLSTL